MCKSPLTFQMFASLHLSYLSGRNGQELKLASLVFSKLACA